MLWSELQVVLGVYGAALLGRAWIAESPMLRHARDRRGIMEGLTHVWLISAYPHGHFPATRYPAALRNVIAGFIAGLLVGAAVTVAGPPIFGGSRFPLETRQALGTGPRFHSQRVDAAPRARKIVSTAAAQPHGRNRQAQARTLLTGSV